MRWGSSSVPLATTISGTSVTVGGIAAPLYFARPNQVTVQTPFELVAGNRYQVQVNASGALSTPGSIQIAPSVPGVAALDNGLAIAPHPDNTLISAASPANPGEYVVIYLAGLGSTDNAVANGAASPAKPLARAVVAPVLTLNGTSIPTLYAGLTPESVGLYQINFQIPAGLADGDYQLVVTQGGLAGLFLQ